MQNLEITYALNQEILEQCLKIRNDVFTVEKNISKTIEVDECDCINSVCDHFLIRLKDENIGAVRCMHISDKSIKVQRFCFYSSHRNSGLGRATIQYIENYYKNQGYNKIELDSKFEVSGFYAKCGYTKISDIFVEAGVDHIKMEKSI